MKWQGKRFLLIGLPVCLLIVVAGATAMQQHKLPADLDVLGMIRGIHTNNDSINTVNSKIVGNMADISRLSDTTAKIDAHLHTLQVGMAAPDASLSHLDTLSQQEVDLSVSFVGLANQLSGDLGTIKQASDSQQRSVQQMIQTTKALSQSAAQVASINGTIAGKLAQATQISGQVAQEMP
jgi:hypothetical protein